MRQETLQNPYIFNRPLEVSDQAYIIPTSELKRSLSNMGNDLHSAGLDIFGPKRRGKTTFANILVEQLRQQFGIEASFLSLATQKSQNFSEFIDILKRATPYQQMDESKQFRSLEDDITEAIADLAIGCTQGGTLRYAVILDGTESLSESVWEALLYGIRNMRLLSRHNRADSVLPESVMMLRWILTGTRDVLSVYRWLSGAATPYSPFERIALSQFSEAEVIELAKIGFVENAEQIGRSVFKKTAGFRFLTQRFLSEAFQNSVFEQAGLNFETLEARVWAHEDPNWQELLHVVKEYEEAKNAVEHMANGKMVLNLNQTGTNALLSTGIFLTRELEVKVGNDYYRRKVRQGWQTQATSSGLTRTRSKRLEALERKQAKHTSALRTFLSYAHEDKSYCAEFLKHLRILERQQKIKIWYDNEIMPGSEWKKEIAKHLDEAELIVFLLSADFLASDSYVQDEMQHALRRYDARQAMIIPIIVRPVEWAITPFEKFRVLPDGAKPVALWPNRDKAWVDIIKGIRRAIDHFCMID